METRSLPPRYRYCKIALSFEDRAALYGRIDRRVDLMMEAGLADEVRGLVRRGLGEDSTAMQAIGYKELYHALNGGCTVEQAVEQIKQSSRRYAKRQLTWFRRNPDVRWLDAGLPFSELFSAARRELSFFDTES